MGENKGIEAFEKHSLYAADVDGIVKVHFRKLNQEAITKNGKLDFWRLADVERDFGYSSRSSSFASFVGFLLRTRAPGVALSPVGMNWRLRWVDGRDDPIRRGSAHLAVARSRMRNIFYTAARRMQVGDKN